MTHAKGTLINSKILIFYDLNDLIKQTGKKIGYDIFRRNKVLFTFILYSFE